MTVPNGVDIGSPEGKFVVLLGPAGAENRPRRTLLPTVIRQRADRNRGQGLGGCARARVGFRGHVPTLLTLHGRATACPLRWRGAIPEESGPRTCRSRGFYRSHVRFELPGAKPEPIANWRWGRGHRVCGNRCLALISASPGRVNTAARMSVTSAPFWGTGGTSGERLPACEPSQGGVQRAGTLAGGVFHAREDELASLLRVVRFC